MEKNQFSLIKDSVAYVLNNFGMKREGRSVLRDSLQEATRIEQIANAVGDNLIAGRPLKLLEIGIGSSMVTSSLRNLYTPMQLSIDAMEHPNVHVLKEQRFVDHLKATQVNLIPADLCFAPWPIADASYDMVIFSETVEHLPPTIVPDVFREIGRVLRPGGTLFVSTPNLAAWPYRWKLFRGKKIFDQAIPLPWAGGTYAHIRLYTPQEIAELLVLFGMKSYSVKYLEFGFLNRAFTTRVFYSLVYKILPALAPEFVMCARKE
jgi:2-polyprenyl-3-methyl-5-hydroxy-6-metoxy-1,4-benzoquinol methylase